MPHKRYERAAREGGRSMADEDFDERGFLSEPGAPDGDGAAKPHYAGHRQRLRARFREAGAAALTDYEILEMLLFRSIPRADTKQRAKALIWRFGSLAEVLGAPEPLLKEVPEIGEAAALDLKL